MKRASLIPLLFAFISCAPAMYNLSTSKDIPSGLLSDKDVLVLTPADGISDGSIEAGSGSKLATKVYYYLNTKDCEVTLDEDHKSIKKIDESELQKYDYVIVPAIVSWEDNATAWSGKPDRIQFTIEIYDKDKKKVASGSIDSKSTNATFTENDPSELIDKPLLEFINKLF